MSFLWHGRGTEDGRVWEQEITRYYFICGEELVLPSAHGPRHALNKDSRVKLTKSEARKFFKDGYIEYHTTVWDETAQHYNRIVIPLSNGIVRKDIETRFLHESPCTPDDVAPPKRKKKVDTAPAV